MLRKLVFISLFSVVSIAVFGQGKITLKEEKVSDLQPQSHFRTKQVGYLFKVNDDEYQAIGYKGERLEEILKTNEKAYKEFKRFKRKLVIGKASYWVGAASPFAYLMLINPEDTEQQIMRKVIGLVTIASGSFITSHVVFKNAPKHLHNAVEIYNQSLN